MTTISKVEMDEKFNQMTTLLMNVMDYVEENDKKYNDKIKLLETQIQEHKHKINSLEKSNEIKDQINGDLISKITIIEKELINTKNTNELFYNKFTLLKYYTDKSNIQTNETTNKCIEFENNLLILNNELNKTKEECFTHKELEKSLFMCGMFEGTTNQIRNSFHNHTINAYVSRTWKMHESNLTTTRDFYNIDQCHVRVIQVNKMYYLYSDEFVTLDANNLTTYDEGIVFNIDGVYNTCTGLYSWKQIGTFNGHTYVLTLF